MVAPRFINSLALYTAGASLMSSVKGLKTIPQTANFFPDKSFENLSSIVGSSANR